MGKRGARDDPALAPRFLLTFGFNNSVSELADCASRFLTPTNEARDGEIAK